MKPSKHKNISIDELENVTGGRGMSNRQYDAWLKTDDARFRQSQIEAGVYNPKTDGQQWLAHVARAHGKSIKEMKQYRSEWITANPRQPPRTS